jgi:hypothetical protein
LQTAQCEGTGSSKLISRIPASGAIRIKATPYLL